MALRLAEDLTLPVEAATQTLLIVGKRGSGKSSTAKRLAEQMIRARVPVVVVDPVDKWWGIKADRTGTGPGLKVHVFGGSHADLPLEPAAGALMADVLVEHRISAVLAVRQWSDGERARFLTDFMARLFQRNTEPLHLVLEEAHEAAPQQPFKGEERMLHHVNRIWKLGRASGLGGSAVTQRPASLHKNITTQAEILVIHRTLGPQDVAAVREWIRYHGEREDVLGQLAELGTGECFVWAPDFPEGRPVGLRRVRMLQPETFDSFATPKIGEERREPKELAPVDLDRLRAQMAATIERAKQEDPRELRRQLAEAKAALARAQTSPPGASPPRASPIVKRVEIPVVHEADFRRAEKLVARLEGLAETLRGASVAVGAEGSRLSAALAMAQDGMRRLEAAGPAVDLSQRPVVQRPARGVGPGEKMAGGARRILTALAQYHEGRTRSQVAVLARYAVDGGGFANLLGGLRTTGWIEGYDAMRITPAGLAALGSYDPLPTGRALLEHWLPKLGKAERATLVVLVAAYPRTLTKQAVAEAAGYAADGGGFGNALGHLRTLELVTGYGELRASEVLFG